MVKISRECSICGLQGKVDLGFGGDFHMAGTRCKECAKTYSHERYLKRKAEKRSFLCDIQIASLIDNIIEQFDHLELSKGQRQIFAKELRSR